MPLSRLGWTPGMAADAGDGKIPTSVGTRLDMTDDLGPGSSRGEDLAEVFAHYVAIAAGVASERGMPEEVAALRRAERVDVELADTPVTASGGEVRAAVEVTIHVPEQVCDVDPAILGDVLTEAADPDGFRVHAVHVVSAGGR